MRRFESGSRSRAGVASQDGPGLIKDQVREIIHEVVVCIVIIELFGSIKTTMMEFYDDRYVALSDATDITATTVVAVGIGTGRPFQYRDFDNTKPTVFDGV